MSHIITIAIFAVIGLLITAFMMFPKVVGTIILLFGVTVLYLLIQIFVKQIIDDMETMKEFKD